MLKKISTKTRYIINKYILPSYSLEELFPNAEKLYPIKPEIVATPEVKQMNLVKLIEGIHSDYYSLPTIYSAHLSKVIYYPKYNLIFTESRKMIKETSPNIYVISTHQIYDLMKKVNVEATKLFSFVARTQKVSGICSIIRRSNHHNNHYHTLVDAIPRLYLLNQSEYQHIDEIKLLFSSEPTTTERFFIDKLAPKNIKITVMEKCNSLYSIEQLIFPTVMSRSYQKCGYLPSKYIQFFQNKVLPKRASKKTNRIFISRAKAKWRKMINEDELFEALKPYGFKKYFLEDISIEAEIDLFFDADYVIGSLGAGLTNMIFSQKIKVLEIFPNEYVHTYYYYLAKSLNHTYGYCNGLEEKSHVATQKATTHRLDFRVNVSEVVEQMLELEKKQKYDNVT
ncbi:DUF563 domain-containing protein [Candidatus Peregrinibacteria bacterium]|nr:DUF563 domain-containing protein [Candidatus Peregrinibacteria bacterium]